MTHDISDAILSLLSKFAVGLVIREEGKGSRVLGSGVLVSVGGRRGILTCGHVADKYANYPEIGLIYFVAGGQQRRIVQLTLSQTLILQSSDNFEESEEVADLAFTWLPPDVASSIEAGLGVFLNIEKNRTKMEALERAGEKYVDAMLGLVEELSGDPFVEGGHIISPMQGVLHTGRICKQEKGLLTVEAMDYNLQKLPKCFGGLSGSGLWRVSFVEDEKESKIAATKLCGIVSWQIDATKLACQGWDRIDQHLFPKLRESFPI